MQFRKFIKMPIKSENKVCDLLRQMTMVIVTCFIGLTSPAQAQSVSDTWKAGVAKINITPSEPQWLAGYASRTSPSTGKLTDIWAKALYLEDAKGKNAVLVTSDLLGLPKAISDNIREKIKEKYHLSVDEVLLNSSHTHSGPVLEGALVDIYELDDQNQQVINEYSILLENKIVELVGMAIENIKPVKIFSENGVARFQVNRRNNNEATLSQQTFLNGPNDYSVPVLKVTDIADNSLVAIAFGYACHPTVLSLNEWSGDYTGFAQLQVEKEHPEALAMFFQCTGADQNPLPRRTVGLAKQYGKTLAAAVTRVVEEEMKELAPELKTSYTEIDLQLETPPTKAELETVAAEKSGYLSRWAKRMIKKIDNKEPLRTSYPYPIQLWKLGDQVMVGLGGEVVIEYAIQIKKLLGDDAFVLGYSNDVMAYIPSEVILEEGGYEGETSQMVYGLPAKWAKGIEANILEGVSDLAKKIEK